MDTKQPYQTVWDRLAGYKDNFGHATDRFVEACKNIAIDPSSGRLGKLIKSLFANSKLSHLVESPVANPGD